MLKRRKTPIWNLSRKCQLLTHHILSLPPHTIYIYTADDFENTKAIIQKTFTNESFFVVWLKTLWQNEKCLFMSNFPFGHNVFTSCLLYKRQKANVCGKGRNEFNLTDLMHSMILFTLPVNYLASRWLNVSVYFIHIFTVWSSEFIHGYWKYIDIFLQIQHNVMN